VTRFIHIREKELTMSKDTDNLLSQISNEIDSKEVEKTNETNKRVDNAYGSGGRGLIVVVQVMQPAKSDDLY
jgi:hypothetical protein